MKYAENISVCGGISVGEFIEHQERLIMTYSKNAVITRTKGYVESIQDYLTEICQICLFMRLHNDTEDSNNPITRDDDFITTLNNTVDDCKTALDNLNNLSKSSNQIIGINEMTDAVAPIGYLRNKTEKMYCSLDIDEWDKDDHPKGVRIIASLDLILVMIDNIDIFLYEVYPDALYQILV